MMIRSRPRGLGQDSLTAAIAQGIAQYEGYNTPGTLAQRNNNPGNLRSGVGQSGTSGGYAVFPDASTGFAALENQIELNIARGLTLNQFFGGGGGYAGYAPSADNNNPSAYAAQVAAWLGIDANTPLNQIDASYAGGYSGPNASVIVSAAALPAPSGNDVVDALNGADQAIAPDTSGQTTDQSGVIGTGAIALIGGGALLLLLLLRR